MSGGRKAIVWFNEVDKGNVSLVGGKGANLGEMTRANIPVPPGFIVTADAYYHFLEESKLIEKIRSLLSDLDADDSKRLQEIAAQIKGLIAGAPMPPEVATAIIEAYRKLGDGLVAVRSSATAEDLPEASFAGQQRTYLNIQGEKEVVAAVQGCWASLFEPRAIFYRVQQGFAHLKVGIAVPVQRMVQSEAAGVMFTLEPITNDRSKIVIQAAYGLGESVVSGDVSPDSYIVDKNSLKILDKEIKKQEWQLIRNPKSTGRDEDNIKVPVVEDKRGQQKLTDEGILTLAKLARELEEHYQFPQDIEWASENGEVYIVQTRPVTTMKSREEIAEVEIEGKVIISGEKASPGAAAGPVRVIHDASEIDKVRDGNVLVAEMTTPDFVPAMKRAAGIITDRGGRTCHAAIVSRELGVPCVVGTENATKVLKDEQIVTVDGSSGKVYEGSVARKGEDEYAQDENLKTKTKVYVNLAQPSLVEAVSKRNFDGVGLLRAEFIIGNIGQHPRYMIEEGRSEEFIRELAEGLTVFASSFSPRPVVYRTTDFKTNEYRNLKGGEKFEDIEENPMLGFRGCSRYVRDVDVFKLEIEAIKRVRQDYKNLWVMIPFVRTMEEMAGAKRIMESEGLARSPEFKLWMMLEVPSNVILMDKFIDVGIDGISIGSNDLTQLILGVDRDNPKLAEEFDERNEAVLTALETVIKTAVRRGITCSICGQAPSDYPDLTAKLVEWGITSISISPDALGRTRRSIYEVEKKLGISS